MPTPYTDISCAHAPPRSDPGTLFILKPTDGVFNLILLTDPAGLTPLHAPLGQKPLAGSLG
jgi:hypothetical protein